MGAGSRPGWYSYDWLDNGRQPSANRILPELHHPDIGTVFPTAPGRVDGFTLLAVEAERVLVLGWLGPGGAPEATWTFVLSEVPPDMTRLVVPVRVGRYPMRGPLLRPARLVIRLVHFIMQRKQLLGIAVRAERTVR